MKKFINAKIYGQGDASEILVENGVFKSIGQNLDDEKVIDGAPLGSAPMSSPSAS